MYKFFFLVSPDPKQIYLHVFWNVYIIVFGQPRIMNGYYILFGQPIIDPDISKIMTY